MSALRNKALKALENEYEAGEITGMYAAAEIPRLHGGRVPEDAILEAVDEKMKEYFCGRD